MPFVDADQMRAYQREWLRKRRAAVLAGRSCVYCGATTELELNHVIPLAIQAAPPGHRMWSRRREVREEQLSRCEITCRRCNRLRALRMGVGRPAAKLTADDVRMIRALDGKVPYADLAQRFGVTVATIRNAARGVTWKVMPDPDFQHEMFQKAAA